MEIDGDDTCETKRGKEGPKKMIKRNRKERWLIPDLSVVDLRIRLAEGYGADESEVLLRFTRRSRRP